MYRIAKGARTTQTKRISKPMEPTMIGAKKALKVYSDEEEEEACVIVDCSFKIS